MKILLIKTLSYLGAECFSKISEEHQYGSYFMFSEDYEPTLRQEIEQTLLKLGQTRIAHYGGTFSLHWTRTENKKSRSIQYNCVMTHINGQDSKSRISLSYSIHTLL